MIGNRYAILIASSNFEDKAFDSLQCPEKDVDGLNEVLSSKERCNFNETLVLKNLPHYEILFKIEQFLEKVGRDDLVLIYYSGHGKQDRTGKLHLAAIDTKVNWLKSTSVPIENLRSLIEASRTKKIILILDCCFSGLVGDAFLRGSADDQLQLLSRSRGIYIMTASTGLQVALEKESENFGVFTKHIIDGIRDLKAINREGDITIDSLYEYVYKQMIQEGIQTPMKWDLNVEGDIIIASCSGSCKQEMPNKRQIDNTEAPDYIQLVERLSAIEKSVESDKPRYTFAYNPNIYWKNMKNYEKLVECINAWDKALKQDIYSHNFSKSCIERHSPMSAEHIRLAWEYQEKVFYEIKDEIAELKLKCIELKNNIELYKAMGDTHSLEELESNMKKINEALPSHFRLEL
jgi:hypothetical protein